MNCAAIYVLHVCEKDLDAAMAINVPSALVNWLDKDAFIIHLSTDQGHHITLDLMFCLREI